MRIQSIVAGPRMLARTLLVSLVTWGATASALAGFAPPAQSSFPEEARERLDHEVGEWESESQNLDRSGTVVSTTYSRSVRRYVIPGRVIEVVGFAQDGSQTSRAWVYYSMREKKYCHTSIDANGSLMTMKGDLGPVFRWSGPMKRSDGSTLLMRFTHTDIEDDSFTALGEISADGGTTWTAFSRQHLTRTGDVPDSTPLAEQSAPARSNLPQEARKRLDYEVGDWESETESLGPDGTVRSTSYSRTQRRYAIPGRLIEIVGFSEDDSHSFQAWVYYSMREKKYCLTSIDANGRLMTMQGDLGPEFRWSGPMKRADGSTLIMRFTHTDIEDDSFTALGEISADGGNTWTAFSRQYLTRLGEGSDFE